MTPGTIWSAGDFVGCERLRQALVPNQFVKVFIPDSDRDGRKLPVQLLVAEIEAAFLRLFGGYWSAAGSGGYLSDGGRTMREQTWAVEAVLPAHVTDELRQDVIALFLEFGTSTNQELILVVVGNRGFRIRVSIQPAAEGEPLVAG